MYTKILLTDREATKAMENENRVEGRNSDKVAADTQSAKTRTETKDLFLGIDIDTSSSNLWSILFLSSITFPEHANVIEDTVESQALNDREDSEAITNPDGVEGKISDETCKVCTMKKRLSNFSLSCNIMVFEHRNFKMHGPTCIIPPSIMLRCSDAEILRRQDLIKRFFYGHTLCNHM